MEVTLTVSEGRPAIIYLVEKAYDYTSGWEAVVAFPEKKLAQRVYRYVFQDSFCHWRIRSIRLGVP